MIMWLWSLTLLVSQLVLGFDHSIDLTRCEESGTLCVVRESCLETGTMDNVLVERTKENLKGGDCDVVLQIKALKTWKFHVMMQVKVRSGSSDKIKVKNGIRLKQGADQFVCKPGTGEGLITGVSHFRFIPEGRQIYEEQHLFCSFFAELKDRSKKLRKIYGSNINKAKLIFTKANNEEVVENRMNGNDLFVTISSYPLYTCDRELVTSKSKVNSLYQDTVWKEVNIVADDFKCSTKFELQIGDTDPIITSEVKCAFNIWNYKDDIDKTMTPIIGSFEIHCPTNRCRLCESAPPSLDGCTGCTNPNFVKSGSDPNSCPTLSCPSNKWTTTGKEIIEGEAECRGTASEPLKSVWFLKENELKQAACMEKIDCGMRFRASPQYPIVLADCPGGTCKIKGLGTNNIKCVTDGDKLKLMPGNYLLDEIECDPQTGRFMETGKEPGSGLDFKSIECIPNPKESKDNSSDNFIGDYLVRVIKKVNEESNITEK